MMRPDLELEAAIALMASVRATVDSGSWEVATAVFSSVGSVDSLDTVLRVAGEDQYIREVDEAWDAYGALKEGMADEDGAWLSFCLTMTPGGEYTFDYNYDDQPQARDGVEVIPELYVEDLQKYPRPWAEIPDWHPVRQQYTAESWEAFLRG